MDGIPFVPSEGPKFDFELDSDGNATSIQVEFKWANGMEDASYGLRSSNHLVDWTSLESEVVDSVDLGLYSMITLSAPVEPLNNSFIRLEVVVAP